MAKPKPPRKSSKDVDRITARTWNALIDCLVYAMANPRGDGATIFNMGDGVLSARRARSAGVGGAMGAYQGPFAVTYDAEDNELKVRDASGGAGPGYCGYCLVNGKAVKVLNVSIPATGSGYLVLKCKAIALGSFTPGPSSVEVSLMSSVPDEGHALAYVDISTGEDEHGHEVVTGATIIQYFQNTPCLFVMKLCEQDESDPTTSEDPTTEPEETTTEGET